MSVAQGVLTERELQVLQLLARGYTNREVGSELYISMRTAEFHRMNIQRKLSARGRADLVRCARELGLVSV